VVQPLAYDEIIARDVKRVNRASIQCFRAEQHDILMQESYAHHYALLEGEHWWFRARRAVLRDLLPILDGRSSREF
jgi:hypothetical protein